MNLKEGKELVKIARKAINSERVDFKFKEKKGVFVTIYNYPKKSLRGCIGFIEPIFGLSEGIYNAAREAAFNDYRFSPINTKKDKFVIEISILTKPELLKRDSPGKIEIGRDGLIVEKEHSKGILLPKVAVEHKFNNEEFLECCCNKAGLGKKEWKDKNCKVYIFQTEVFSEEKPNEGVRKLL